MEKYLDKLIPGETYHIYNHAVGKDTLFRNHENYRYFLQQFNRYTGSFCEVYCYCLLPNHFHFLIRIKSAEELKDFKYLDDLSKPFSNLFNSYSKSFNIMYHRMGSLFMRPFKRIHVDSGSYFTTLIRYIHFNPEHHGFCSSFADWEFSSYKSLAGNQPTHLLRKEVVDWFGNIEQFNAFHQQPVIIKKGWEFED